MTRDYGHYVDGVALAPGTDLIERRSPGTGEVVARYTAGTSADAEMAVAAARRAFDDGPWPKLTGLERARVLQEAARLMRGRADDLARIEAEETGKPWITAQGDVESSIAMFEYAAGLAMTSHGDAHTNLGPDCTALVIRQPVGVVGMIIPWNFPLLLLAQKLPYALAAGCTAVVKPSEFTSGTALELAAILTEAGVPTGVVNVVTGTGGETGRPLSRSGDVDFLSFTGSTATGKAIIADSQENVKRLSMELGGKAANIVFADADLGDALDGVLWGVLFNNGECCVSGARLLVEDSIADEFVGKLVEAIGRINVAQPLDPAGELGPMIHPGHLDKVLGYIELAQSEGGTLLAGGTRLTDGTFADGQFVAPTVIDGIGPDNRVFHEEIFGPVLTITRFSDADEAIRLANATEYGLAASFWTKDVDKVLTVSQALRSGRVWVNTTIDGAPSLPAGGMKQSGYGREMGQAGFDEFLDVKTIQIRTGARKRAFPRWTAGL